MRQVLVLTRDIAAPPSVVWDIVSDIDGSPRVMRGIEQVERIPGPGGAIIEGYHEGSAWRETRRMFGQSASEDMVVTQVDPEHSTTIETVAADMRYITSFHLEETPGGGTVLTFEFSGDQPRQRGARQLALDIVGAVGRAVTKRIMAKDLTDIASAAEARARGSRRWA